MMICLLLIACSDNEAEVEKNDMDSLPVFNAETLKEYNGENGQRAYVAVDGIVYDVTDVPEWQSPHGNGYTPGFDYSEEIKLSPHGKSKLNSLEIVGAYEE